MAQTLVPVWIFSNLISCHQEALPKLEHHPPCKAMFGRSCRQRRDVRFFSTTRSDGSLTVPGYRYSGQTSVAFKLTPNMRPLLDYVNEFYGATFNGILVNHYANGHDYISDHADDEDDLDDEAGVVTISYGATRHMTFRQLETAHKLKLPLQEQWMISMRGQTQSKFTHGIPKELPITGARMSFTFRKHKEKAVDPTSGPN